MTSKHTANTLHDHMSFPTICDPFSYMWMYFALYKIFFSLDSTFLFWFKKRFVKALNFLRWLLFLVIPYRSLQAGDVHMLADFWCIWLCRLFLFPVFGHRRAGVLQTVIDETHSNNNGQFALLIPFWFNEILMSELHENTFFFPLTAHETLSDIYYFNLFQIRC